MRLVDTAIKAWADETLVNLVSVRRLSQPSVVSLARALLCGVAAAAVGVAVWSTPIGGRLEETAGLDWLFSSRGPVPAPDDVVVVSIDRRSAAALGYDPQIEVWPRDVHARLIDALVAAGVDAVAFDIIFEKPRDPDTDAALAMAIRDSGRAVLFERLDRAYEPAGGGDGGPQDRIETHRPHPPLPAFAAAAAGLAPFPLPKVPARVGQVWVFQPAAGGLPTLPATTLQVAARDVYPAWRARLVEAGAAGAAALPAALDPGADADALRKLMVDIRSAFVADPGLAGRLRQALDRTARDDGASGDAADRSGRRPEAALKALVSLYAGEPSRYLNYYGPAGTIRTIPIHALVDGVAAGPRERGLDLAGRTVFVGASELFEPEQRDGFYTVFTGADGVDLSGVEIAATAYANMVEDRWLRQPEPAHAIALVAGFGLVVGMVVFLLPPLIGVTACLGAAAGYAAVTHATFAAASLWLPVMTPLVVQTPFALVAGLLGRYVVLRNRLLGYIIQIVPRDIARQFSLERFARGDGDREVQAVCLATDAASYARFAETWGPTDSQRILNALLERIIGALEPRGADICEISVDGLMAAWVIAPPLAEVDVRRRACLAAIDALHAAEGFNRNASPAARLPIRIGLNVGKAFVGNVGPHGRLVYGTRGDTPVTASRLEGANKILGTRILAAAPVAADVADILVRPLGDFLLAGKELVVPVVEILGRAVDATAAEHNLCLRFAAALARFQAGEFDAADAMLASLHADFPDDGPTAFLRDQCQRRRTEPPPGEPVVFAIAKQ